jgi:hypothetical protein
VRRVSVLGGESVAVPQPHTAGAPCTPWERSEALVWICEEGESFSDVWMIEDFDAQYALRRR